MMLNDVVELACPCGWRGNGPPAANRRGRWALRPLSRSLAEHAA